MNFFRDKDGKIVVWQKPNTLLWIWIVSSLISMISESDNVKAGFGQISTFVLFAWALMEATSGASTFRRLLGLVVTGWILIRTLSG